MLLTPTMTTGDLSVSNERRGKWINPARKVDKPGRAPSPKEKRMGVWEG